MSYFEGKEFSSIHDQMPGRLWDKAHFISDWQQQMEEVETLFNEDDLRIACEVVLTSFYDTYEQCVEMLNDERSLTLAEKQKMFERLNLAMTNLLEFGQRSTKNISSSLVDRKLAKEEKGSEVFNDIVDLLIQELQQANNAFFKKQEEFYDKKQKGF